VIEAPDASVPVTSALKTQNSSVTTASALTMTKTIYALSLHSDTASAYFHCCFAASGEGKKVKEGRTPKEHRRDAHLPFIGR